MNTTYPFTFAVDSFANGISWGSFTESDSSLLLEEETEILPLRSRHPLYRSDPFQQLEKQLIRLSQRGILRRSLIYFGVATDPFFPFEGKFDASMKFLQLFQRYTPGALVIQTRSPLLVIAMPVLTKLAEHVTVTYALESSREDSISRYTPGAPRVAERVRAITALRRFGVQVTIQASPILPYGDWKRDAGEFADLINAHADSIVIGALTNGSEARERYVRGLPIARKLAEDRKYHWLRPDSARPLEQALQARCPEKLNMPMVCQHIEAQMSLFAD
jgi:DNA repair photolyase